MTKNNEPSDPSVLADEELVAYLDGELDADAGRRIEALLATDPELRRRLQALERTWQLLDELDTAPVGDERTQTTLEMVAYAASDDAEREQSELPRRRRKWWLKVIACVIIAVVAGFAAVAAFGPDPNRQLLTDLPLLERFDEYRNAESVAYLQMLRDKGLFVPEGAQSQESATEDEPIEQRRRRVASMDFEEKEEIQSAMERFDGLTPAERQRMKQLYESLSDAPRLQTVMQRYDDWLKTLSPYNRASLREMKPAERIEWIKKRLRWEEHRKIVAPLDGKDLNKLRQWSGAHASKYQKQYLEAMPDAQRKRLAELDSKTVRWIAFEQMMQRWRKAGSEDPLPMMNDAEMKLFSDRLSPEAKKRLESVKPGMRWALAATWLRRGMHGPRHFGGGPKTDDERLLRFFEEELDGEQRDRLLGMSVEDMQRELRRLYLMSSKSHHGQHRRNGGKHRGDWPPGKGKKPAKKPL